MRTSLSRRALLVVPALALIVPLAAGPATPAIAAEPEVGGFAEAYGLLVDATLLAGNVPVNIGPLAPVSSSCPPSSAAKTAEVLGPVGDPQVAQADVIRSGAGTDCTKASTMGSAQTVNLDALGAAAPLAIHADVITATSATTCTSAPKGSTVFTNLTVGGTAVPLPTDVPPNFDLLPQLFGPLGLRVILNEQHPAAAGRGLVVNGLHVIAANTGQLPIGGQVIRGDVVVSHAVSGVVCPGGPGTDNGGLPTPDISFAKTAAPLTPEAGDSVTYTATVTNTSAQACEVLRLVDHIAPAFDLVSTAGAFGSAFDKPAPVRTDGGVDAVLRPTTLTIAPKASATQTFTVKVRDKGVPGTYYNSLELYCGVNGDFVSGPLAPVTVVATGTLGSSGPVAISSGSQQQQAPQLPRTGGSPLVATAALLLLAAALGTRRLQAQHH
ncbi:MAG: putative internalin [Frankiales bacterium]|nr:putative internalin [Frankiales bacterium]